MSKLTLDTAVNITIKHIDLLFETFNFQTTIANSK